AVAGAVDQAQDLAGLGQGEDQGMVAPGAVVGDVHALLALAGGFDQAAIHVEGGLGEKGRGLLGPNLATDVVEDVTQGRQVGGREAAAEIASGGGIGQAAGAQGIEEDLVLAAQVHVLQTGAFAQGVVGKVEDVIGLVVGQMQLQQVQPLVDGVGQSEPLGEEVQ